MEWRARPRLLPAAGWACSTSWDVFRGVCLALALALGSALGVTVGAPCVASAQEAESLEEARAAAEAARGRSAAAQAELERARAELAEAEARADGLAEAEAKAAAAAEAEGPAVETLEARAERRAREAEEAALEAQRQVLILEQRVRELELSQSYARTGPYLGIGLSYAFEDFDSGIDADDSAGIQGRIGYRVHPHVALEARVDYFDDFDVKVRDSVKGDFEPLVATGGLRIFFLTGRFQPYVGAAAGAMRAEAKGRRLEADGVTVTRFDQTETEFAVRLSGGMDIYLTRKIVLVLDAGYTAAAGDLDDFSFGTVGGGLDYRF